MDESLYTIRQQNKKRLGTRNAKHQKQKRHGRTSNIDNTTEIERQ
jgi:hypothetical protein